MKRGVYETNNQPKKSTFRYNQYGRLCLGVTKVENKHEKITGKHCPVFSYKGKKIVTIDAYKNEIINEFARIMKLTLSSSPWVKR